MTIIRPDSASIHPGPGAAFISAVGGGDLDDGSDDTYYRFSGTAHLVGADLTMTFVKLTFPATTVGELYSLNLRARALPATASPSTTGYPSCAVSWFDADTLDWTDWSSFASTGLDGIGPAPVYVYSPSTSGRHVLYDFTQRNAPADTYGYPTYGPYAPTAAFADVLAAGRLVGALNCKWETNRSGVDISQLWVDAQGGAAHWPRRQRQRRS